MPIYRVPDRSRPLQSGPYSRPVGPLAIPPVSEDHSTSGALFISVSTQATVSTTKDITGHLAAGVVPRRGTNYPYPKTISGNKVLDQNGNVFLAYTFSSWRMAQRLSNADITDALVIAQNLNFNGVTVWMGGGEDRGGAGQGQYTNLAGDNFWTGTPWAMDSGTTLGPAWSSVDRVISEADRLGIIVHFSFCSGFSTFGPGSDWDAATNADMTKVGEAVASRYAGYDNIVWHIMFDDTQDPGSTRGARANALFTGINNVEGTSRRPFRWTEVNNNSTTDDQGWYDPSGASNATRFSMNAIYRYDGSSAEDMENARTQITTGLIGDCEPRYVDNAYTTGNNGQQLRDRICGGR